MTRLTRDQKTAFFLESKLCMDLSPTVAADLAAVSHTVLFKKEQQVSRAWEVYTDVFFVVSGLLRVSVCSASGRRITFLLVKEKEVYNMISPFVSSPRVLEAQALEPTCCLRILGREFLSLVTQHSGLSVNMIRSLGKSCDNANSRIIDQMESKVERRILRVLSSLYKKFGSPIKFTSVEISEIAGTTPESCLRVMGHLRDRGIIETQRGSIRIVKPESLPVQDIGDLLI